MFPTDFGFWGPWSEYSSCSVTCGEGLQVRYRQCFGGPQCKGDFEQIQSCSQKTVCLDNSMGKLFFKTKQLKQRRYIEVKIKCSLLLIFRSIV
jgi:hypothetical protein